MSRLWCDDPDEERRQARQDFHSRGRYGYDRERYRGDDDCDAIYTREFDRLRLDQDEERRAEERSEEMRAEQAAEYRRQEQAMMDEAYLYEQQQYEQEPEPEAPAP